MTAMPHLPTMEWDFKDQLSASQQQRVSNGGTGEKTYYIYDAAGQRVLKITEQANGNLKDERMYLGGFEIYRQHSGPNAGLVRESLHIMDDKQRIALVETRTDRPTSEQLIRYQFGNHLGSASLELAEDGALISYEEYHPYGTTAFQAGRSAAEASLKRYRYTGKERDEESGLDYYGARYYASWLGRWASADPAALSDGTNMFHFVHNDPIGHSDFFGHATEELEVNKSAGTGTHERIKVLLEKHGQSVDEEVVSKPGKGGSRHDLKATLRDANKPKMTHEAKSLTLGKTYAEGGKLNESQLRHKFKRNLKQAVKHTGHGGLPERLQYELKGATKEQAKDVRELFRKTAREYAKKTGTTRVKGGVTRAEELDRLLKTESTVAKRASTAEKSLVAIEKAGLHAAEQSPGRFAKALPHLIKAGKYAGKAMTALAGVGLLMSAASTAHAMSEHRYGEATMEVASNLPGGVGSVVSVGQAAYSLTEAVNEALIPETTQMQIGGTIYRGLQGVGFHPENW